AALGAVEIARRPAFLHALNPLYGIDLLIADPWRGFVLLGSVVLAATGAEALYADVGRFGRAAIRAACLRIVFAALVLDYFGQVDVPRINNVLLIAVVALVLGVKSSHNLGAAYGIAVTGTMTITTLLAFLYMRRRGGWPLWSAAPLFLLFLVVDLAFFSANLL